jgi:hypothetical protein
MTCGAKGRPFCKVAARLAGDLLRCKMVDGGCPMFLTANRPCRSGKGVNPLPKLSI